MTDETILSLLHRGTRLAAIIPSTSEDRIAWIGVYPLNLKSPDTLQMLLRRNVATNTTMPVYRLRTFEVDRALVDKDKWISDDDLTNDRDAIAVGDDDLREKLAQFGARLDQLEQHFKSDYPI